MSMITSLGQMKRAIRNLNPAEVRSEAERELRVALVAESPARHGLMESYLCPPELTAAKRAQAARSLYRVSPAARGRESCDLELWDESLLHPERAFTFDPAHPGRMVTAVLDARFDLALGLAKRFPPFRMPVIDRTIRSVAKENALFSVATALPDIVPLISLPWVLGEFASDTAFLTMNQIRMAFLIAAASDAGVGYREQRGQIGSIVAGAFGFRAIARELVAKIPLGGGLIPKAAIAWSGTWVVGRSMERLHSLGYAYTREERKALSARLFGKGKQVVETLLRRPETA